MTREKLIAKLQTEICQKYGVDFFPSPDHFRVGIAKNVRSGLQPINGLRRPVENSVCGWYIWAGEEWSDADDFFEPLCVRHLSDWCPQVIKYLALPPGYRFLIDDKGHEDVWFDGKLLHIY